MRSLLIAVLFSFPQLSKHSKKFDPLYLFLAANSDIKLLLKSSGEHKKHVTTTLSHMIWLSKENQMVSPQIK